MKKKKNLMNFMKRVITGFMKEGRPGTAHVYQSTYNRVLDFMGGRPLPFAELTPSWLKAFQNYLLSWQLQWNSISTYMRMLRAVYFRAVDEGLAPARFRLFHGVYTGTRVTVKRAIDAGLLRCLQKPLPEHTGLEKARKLFLLLFMLRGIPFVDIAYLRRCDLEGDILTYRRRKTGAWLTVRIEPEARKLIQALQSTDTESPYIFPFIRYPGTDEIPAIPACPAYLQLEFEEAFRSDGTEGSIEQLQCPPQLGYSCQFLRLSAGADFECHGAFLGKGNGNLLPAAFRRPDSCYEPGDTFTCFCW